MPFTVSHSAAVLPFLRSRRLSATGLIIGTMAPDFEYFFRMNVKGIYGHTIAGIFYFDVPVAIFLAFVFHSIVKKNLIDQFPVFFQKRFQQVRNLDFTTYFKSNWIAFIISTIIGTATHIIWDGFTHQRQFFVQALPEIYEGRTLPLFGINYPLWYSLQIISTIVGGVLILIYVLIIKPEAGIFNRPRISYWIFSMVIIAVIVLVRMQFYTSTDPRYVVIVITICSSFCIAITILGLIPFKRRETSG